MPSFASPPCCALWSPGLPPLPACPPYYPTPRPWPPGDRRRPSGLARGDYSVASVHGTPRPCSIPSRLGWCRVCSIPVPRPRVHPGKGGGLSRCLTHSTGGRGGQYARGKNEREKLCAGLLFPLRFGSDLRIFFPSYYFPFKFFPRIFNPPPVRTAVSW